MQRLCNVFQNKLTWNSKDVYPKVPRKDNMEVVNRIKYGIQDNMSAEKFVKTDFDVWYESHKVTRLLNTGVCARWVQGHQDRFLQDHQGGVRPMPMKAHYNILMDQRADRRHHDSVITLPTLPMTTDRASLVIEGAFVTTKIDDYIRQALTETPLIAYINTKMNWTTRTFHSVDWTAFGNFMGRLSVSKRAKVVKLQHNWQNTGRQKGLFLRSANRDDEALEAEKCPMGCGHHEEPLHYLFCHRNPKKDEMVLGLNGIRKWMKNQDTDPGLVSIMMRILRKVLNCQSDELRNWNFANDPYREHYDLLIKSQRSIGWPSIFKGRISKTWQQIQQKHMTAQQGDNSNTLYRTAEWWAAGLIQQLIYFTLNTWQIRNDHLHKEKEQKETNKIRREVQEEMEEWYKRAPALGRRFDKYIQMPLLQRKTQSTKQLQSWVAMMQEQTKYDNRNKNLPRYGRTEQDYRTRAQSRTQHRLVRRVDRPQTTLLDHYFNTGGGNKKHDRKGRRNGKPD